MSEPSETEGMRVVFSPESLQSMASLGLTIYITKTGEVGWTLGEPPA